MRMAKDGQEATSVWVALTTVENWCVRHSFARCVRAQSSTHSRYPGAQRSRAALPAPCRYFHRVTATPDGSTTSGCSVVVQSYKVLDFYAYDKGVFAPDAWIVISQLASILAPGARAAA